MIEGSVGSYIYWEQDSGNGTQTTRYIKVRLG